MISVNTLFFNLSCNSDVSFGGYSSPQLFIGNNYISIMSSNVHPLRLFF